MTTARVDNNVLKLNSTFKHLEKQYHHCLSHEYGSGAPCLECSNCSGLDLHYWRKICKICGCKIDSHDIPSVEHQNCDIVVCSLFNNINHCNHTNMLNEKMYYYDNEMLKNASKDWSTSDDDSTIMKSSSSTSSTISNVDSLSSKIRKNENVSSTNVHIKNLFRTDSITETSISNPRSLDESINMNNNIIIDKTEIKDIETNNILNKEWNKTEEAQNNCKKFIENAKNNDFGIAKSISIQCNENDFDKLNDKKYKKEEIYYYIKDKKVFDSTCKNCGLDFNDDEKIIITNHNDNVFHKQCFKCSKCENLLEDLLYFFKNKTYLCGRHYGDESYPRCHGCDELIFTKEYTDADGYSWHNEHFCCSNCDSPLGGMKYVHVKGEQYCFKCHGILFHEMCNTCKQTIKPEESRLSHKGYIWHNKLKCFKCVQCNNILINRKFVFKEGKTFCTFECKRKYESYI